MDYRTKHFDEQPET